MSRASLFPVSSVSNKYFGPEHFTEEELLIKKTVEQIVQDKIIHQLDSMEAYEYDIVKSLLQEVGELGLLGVDVPEEFGGLDLGKKVAGLILEEMGYGSSFGVSFNIHTGVGMAPYVYFGSQKQKETYLPKLTTGEWIGAYALTEPNAGSDALATNTTAKLSDDNSMYILNGEKQWISNAHIAKVYVVFARTVEGMTAFIVERDMPGVTIGSEEQKLGIKGASTATLILENVFVPKENILGERGKGHYIALNILNLARLKLAFSNIGSGKQAFETAIKYGKERKQFQREIVQFTMIQEKIADMALAIYRSESSSYYTACLIDEENLSNENIYSILPNYAIDCAINKVDASEMLDFVVDESLQIHGGYGYMEEYPIERMYRDARINRIFEGTNEINRLTISRNFVKWYRKDDRIVQFEGISTDGQYNEWYVDAAHKLLQTSVKALANSEVVDINAIEDEQEILRIIADMVRELYVMKTCLIRLMHAKKKAIQEVMNEVICNESYRYMEELAIDLGTRVIASDQEKKAFVKKLRNTDVPYHMDTIALKRKIANYMIDQDGYQI